MRLSNPPFGRKWEKDSAAVNSEALETVRKKYQTTLERMDRIKVKKSIGWLTLKRPQNLSQQEIEALAVVRQVIPELAVAYVDRKDLDRQTREEFNRLQPGCVEENTNTEPPVRRLLPDDHADKVIVTTTQKLGLALDANHRKEYRKRLEPLQDKRMVFIFDECHRSQFGGNHQAIRK